MFTFVSSCCSPHIFTSQQKSSTECLIWCQSGCVRILPFDRLRGLCHSTVSLCIFVVRISGSEATKLFTVIVWTETRVNRTSAEEVGKFIDEMARLTKGNVNILRLCVLPV